MSVAYTYSWSSRAKPFLGSSPVIIVLYCLRSEIPRTWKVRFSILYPPGIVRRRYNPKDGFPFFVASNGWQIYGEGIRIRLHSGLVTK